MEPTPAQPSPDTAPQTDQPAPYPDLPPQNTLLFGRFGLRAGFGILAFVIAFAIMTTLGSLAALAVTGHLQEVIAAQHFAKTHPGAPHHALHFAMTPLFTATDEAVWFFGLLAVGWLLHKAEHRPMRSFGLGTYRWPDVFAGAAWGLLLMSGLVGLLRADHLLVFDVENIHGLAILHFGLGWLLAFLLVGLAEEFSFRGYIQYTLMRGLWGLAEHLSPTRTRAVAFWLAATILSVLFALVHMSNGGETAFGLLQVFFAGMAFSFALWRTGSLWWGIGFHATWDWAQSFLFGVADSGTISFGRLFVTHPQGRTLLSGGSTGPEGSIFGTVALALTILILRFTTHPGAQPAIEPGASTSEPASGTNGFHNAVA